MLMPILTVKAVTAPTAHAAAVVETTTPKDRAPTLPPIRISGRQSEAMLKILETLNRHLVGSEPLPREALVRLLDTLAKVLKFPPLPQESLRDFSRRLAVFLETLPPAVRQAVEKQLGQRNLAVSIRILTEALKMPSLLDTPRQPGQAFTPLTPARAILAQPDRHAQTLPVQQSSARQQPVQQQSMPPAQPLPHAGSNPILASAAFVPDPGILQAALKKAFGDDEEPAAIPVIVLEEHEDDLEAMPSVDRRNDGAKAQTPRSADSAAAGASARMPVKANDETIPLLRAAAAFLAADPEALSQVSAIASGEIDSQVMTDLQEELNLPLPETMDLADQTTQPGQTEPQKAWEQPNLAPQTALSEPAVQTEPAEQERAPQPQAEQPAQHFEEPAQKPSIRAEAETRFERPLLQPVRDRQTATGQFQSALRQELSTQHLDPQPATTRVATKQEAFLKPPVQAEAETRFEQSSEPVKERQTTTTSFRDTLRQELPTPHLDPQPAAIQVVAKAEASPQNSAPLQQPAPAKNNEEVAGFRGHDLGEWELDIESPAQLLAPSEDSPPAQFEPEDSPDEKVFSQALKALVEASIPLPEGTAEWNASDTLFSALAGETADMEAGLLFAELEAADDTVMLPDTTLVSGDIGDGENALFEADTFGTLLETPEDGPANRASLSHAAITDEPAREAQPQRPPEAIVARDAIPFAIIPYLPAKTEGMKSVTEEDDEQPSFAGHDDPEQGENHETRDEQERESDSASSMEPRDDTTEAGDAYDLYRRMGGLG